MQQPPRQGTVQQQLLPGQHRSVKNAYKTIQVAGGEKKPLRTSHRTSSINSPSSRSVQPSSISYGSLKREVFKIPKQSVTDEIRRLYEQLQKKFTHVTEEFLDLFEQRYIVFIADGTDVESFRTQEKEYDRSAGHVPLRFAKPLETHMDRRQVCIDVNRHALKYDFDVAQRLNPQWRNMGETTLHKEQKRMKNQQKFNTLAFKEVLQLCSDKLSDGRTTYNAMWSYADRLQIRSLDDIPADCKVVLLTEILQ